jgi:hypothetical protein
MFSATSSVWSAFNCRSASDFGVPSPRPAITRRRSTWPVRLASTRCFMSERGEITGGVLWRLDMRGPYVLCHPPSIPPCDQTLAVVADCARWPRGAKTVPRVARGGGANRAQACAGREMPPPVPRKKNRSFPPGPGTSPQEGPRSHGLKVPIGACRRDAGCGPGCHPPPLLLARGESNQRVSQGLRRTPHPPIPFEGTQFFGVFTATPIMSPIYFFS